MSLFVKKFGGSSLATPAQIDSVAKHLHQFWERGDSVVCVVSAMGNSTDDLANLAYQLNDKPPPRELDMLLTVGERISMALLSISLAKLSVPAISLTGSQSGVLTDDVHGNASILEIKGDRIKQGLNDKKVVIVAGYQGMCLANKEITTLGRGGSDVSAIALAVHLKADECSIYKDVEGVFTADPSLCDEARIVDELTWREMYILAENGNGVVHPRAVKLAAHHKLPIHVKSSFAPNNRGTFIHERDTMEQKQITGMADKHELCLFECRTINPSGYAAKMTRWLREHDAVFSLFDQSMADGKTYVWQVFPQKLLRDFRVYTASLDFEVEFIRAVENLAIITVVGMGLNRDADLVENMFSKINVPVYATALNDDSCKFIIDDANATKVAAGLHSII